MFLFLYFKKNTRRGTQKYMERDYKVGKRTIFNKMKV